MEYHRCVSFLSYLLGGFKEVWRANAIFVLFLSGFNDIGNANTPDEEWKEFTSFRAEGVLIPLVLQFMFKALGFS